MASPPQANHGLPDRTDPVDRTAYPFVSRWMDLPSGRMHYVDEGTGEPLLFVHGTPTWSFEWRHLVRAFAPTHRCIAPDHIGFGLSDRPRNFAYTPEAHSANLVRFVEELDPEPFTLVVHDFGGPIGLALCIEHPERVRRLVLVNTWMWSFAGDCEMERNGRVAASPFGGFLYRWANFSLRVITPYAYADRSKLTPQIYRQYLERFPDRWSRGAVLWALARALLGSSQYYDSLWSERERLRGWPALILWGMKDPAFRPYQLARWRQVLPSARVAEFENAGHWPHEEAPDRVILEMRDFLSCEDFAPSSAVANQRAKPSLVV
jgi:pimeloyl-ACP methyl ester carboxylesterase